MSLTPTKTTEQKSEFDFNQVEKITKSMGDYIVKPAGLFGIAGFIFDVQGESKAQLQSNITDNYVEDNTTVQDHVAVAPEKLTLTNYVGELVNKKTDDDAKTKVADITSRLTPIVAYAPQLLSAAKAIQGRIQSGEAFDANTLSDADNMYALFKNLNPTAAKQQRAYIFFKALQSKGVLMSLQTPFQYYRNMAIESLIATQGEESQTISTFQLTLKEMRFASTTTVAFDPKKFQNRAKNQNAPKVNNGKAQGTKKKTSALAKILSL